MKVYYPCDQKQKKKKRFDPDSEFVEQATADYLASGGTIILVETERYGPDFDDYGSRLPDMYCGIGRRIRPNFPIGYFG